LLTGEEISRILGNCSVDYYVCKSRHWRCFWVRQVPSTDIIFKL